LAALAGGFATAIAETASTSPTRARIAHTPRSARLRPAQAATSRRPNIVFVLTDDLSMNLIRFMPQVQALEARGLTFDNYFVSDSLCCPSRSSIFTGNFPHDTGVFENTGPDGGISAFSSQHLHRVQLRQRTAHRRVSAHAREADRV
jgi:N-acetylglucosamine-6-sulfatase